jgi:aspartate 4-decarboxylase
MDPIDLDRVSKLNPFELKNELLQRATIGSERLMLNAGRANPNFLATAPRQAFLELGLFALSEAQRSAPSAAEGVGGLRQPEGLITRFERFAQAHKESLGSAFLVAALSHARCQLGLPEADLLRELVLGILGCNYPEPPRMLSYVGEIVRRFLQKELAGKRRVVEAIDLFAVEGATAGITYVLNSLRENRLLVPGNKIALGMPIFAPYIEIPRLNDYRLVEVAVDADPEHGWQYPDCELDKLLGPEIRIFLVVNPGNPTSVKIDRAAMHRISDIVASQRQDLIILTDDVYAMFADDFDTLFATCPQNTILIYSFSKYFGATGWRLGVVAMHENNVADNRIAALAEADRLMLDARYGSLVLDPRRLKFIDRMVADSRSIALNHTAGLSTPQQVQMALFAFSSLMDEPDGYKQAVKSTVRRRCQALYRELGFEAPNDPNSTSFYAVLDLEVLGAQRYGRAFVDWLLRDKNPLEILFRLADEGGVVLLPGKGFGTPHPSARVSLANLDDEDYAKIGRIIRTIMQGYFDEYRQQTGCGRQAGP